MIVLRSPWKAFACVLGVAALCLPAAACGGSDADDDDGSPARGTATGPVVPPIKMLGPSPAYDPGENESLKVVAEEMEKLGFTVELEGVPDFGTFDELAQQHEFDIGSTGYLGSLPRLEPTELMGPALTCENVDASNYSGYCNDEFEQHFQDALQSSDPEERHAASDAAQVQLAEDLPMVVMYYPTVSTVDNQETASDGTFNPSTGFFNFWSFNQAVPSDGSLTFGIAEPGVSMNPMCNSAYFQVAEYQLLVFDPLTRVAADGSVENWAASEIERVDDTTVLVTLRDGMEFHDGSPVTAEDVAFTFNYVKKWKVGRYLNQAAVIKSVKAEGDDQVRFELKEPYGPLEFALLSGIGIMPKKIWDGVTEREDIKTPCDWKNPSMVGSGPYTFVSYDPNSALRLERNPDHFSPPEAEELVGRFYATQQSLFLDLRAGNVDYHDADPGFTPSQIKQAESDEHLAIQRSPSTTVRFFAFNLREGSPFQDYPLRKAVAQLVDYDTIVGGILQGQAVAGKGIIAPANELWHADAAVFPEYDPEAARRTLEEAGYGWDDQGRLHMPADREPQEFAEAGT